MRYFLILLMTLFSTTAALAEPYIGLGIGSAFYKADLTGLGGGSIDDNATATKFMVVIRSINILQQKQLFIILQKPVSVLLKLVLVSLPVAQLV